MLGCLVMLALGFAGVTIVKSENFIFIFETIAIEAFGLAWIVKGETLLQDGKRYFSCIKTVTGEIKKPDIEKYQA